MRLYVAGPMTGLKDFNYPAFNAAESDLRAVGHDVLNPVCGEQPPAADDTRTWEWFLRRALRQVTEAEGVAVLPGWEKSRGAQLEVYVATALNMPVRDVYEWIAAAYGSAA